MDLGLGFRPPCSILEIRLSSSLCSSAQYLRNKDYVTHFSSYYTLAQGQSWAHVIGSAGWHHNFWPRYSPLWWGPPLGRFLNWADESAWPDSIGCLSCPQGGLVEWGRETVHKAPKFLATICHTWPGTLLNQDVIQCWPLHYILSHTK